MARPTSSVFRSGKILQLIHFLDTQVSLAPSPVSPSENQTVCQHFMGSKVGHRQWTMSTGHGKPWQGGSNLLLVQKIAQVLGLLSSERLYLHFFKRGILSTSIFTRLFLQVLASVTITLWAMASTYVILFLVDIICPIRWKIKSMIRIALHSDS